MADAPAEVRRILPSDWRHPPEWFRDRLKEYKRLSKLDASGWLVELARCARLHRDTEARFSSRPTFSEEWGWAAEPLLEERWGPGFIGPPAIEVVQEASQASLRALEKPALIVKVYLGATDQDIVAGFKEALRAARRFVPSPVKKPGPQTLDASFSKTVFARWVTNKIVQLCELEEWRSKLPKDARPSNADFGRWLFSRYADPDRRVSEAFGILNSAIAAVPALTVQVESAATGGVGKRVTKNSG
jgi:hypothetical protein